MSDFIASTHSGTGREVAVPKAVDNALQLTNGVGEVAGEP